ncbi:MAG TPA: TonB-dependent receptor [Rhizomicrobium sp.]|nr:TonB-dependent receptor [Rhizomicrobium sp.]
MHKTAGIRSGRTKVMLMGGSMVAAMMVIAPSVANAQQTAANVEQVTVTGYAASLEKATDAKRNATNFTDTVFAEDIGKFPDTDVAESLNRIPGVTINREIDGEGVSVSIRGLGSDFTKVTLNGASIDVASTGPTDQGDTFRAIDLNMFPTELFTQLSVSKSPTADLIEGGASGNVNMRSLRPYDNEGFHITYNLQGSSYSGSPSLGERGTLIVSDTWGNFGALIGLSGVQNKIFTTGWEDGNAGWGTPSALSAAQCPAANCHTLGSSFWSIPTTVPANVTTGGLVPGTAITSTTLTALNPGLTPQQISNMLLPRLGRTMYERGSRDRYNGVASFEWRPTEDLHFYMDMIGGRIFNDMDRSDLDWGVRAGAGSQALIPENVVLDPGSEGVLGGVGGVVQSGTFANSQLFLEARPYHEKGDFFSVNPGGSWQINDLMHVDFQANASRSHFFRDSPTYLFVTCPSAGNPAGVPGCTPPAGGVTVNFNNPPGAAFPTITSNIDTNNPANFQWNNGRVNLQDEKRYTYTNGAHIDGTWGGDRIALKAGLAYDDTYRSITAIDDSQQWQNAICGDNPSQFLPPGNTSPSCIGLNVPASGGTSQANIATVNAVSAGSVPNYMTMVNGTNYFGYGYPGSYSAAFPTMTFGGSLVPQSALAQYLVPGPTGFITANYAALAKASNYAAFDAASIAAVGNSRAGITEGYPFTASATSGGNSGVIEEKNYGWYASVVGKEPIHGHNLRYNVGLRFVETHQYITSPVTVVNPLNSTIGPSCANNPCVPGVNNATGGASLNGGQYPNTYTFATQKKEYGSFLPSADAVYEVTDDFQVRAALSRTMTRANPNFMISGVNFSDLTASSVTVGNPSLKPYYSNNIDIGAEYYTGGAGYIGFTAFRKGLSGYPVQQNVTQPFSYLAQFGITYNTLNATQQIALAGRGCTSDASCPATVTVTQQINAPGMLTINGMELDYVQPLDFLLDDYGLHGFGFTGNATILDQRSSGAAPAFAQGVAPFSYNVTGYYDNNGVSLRLSYVWNDKTYGSASNTQSLCLPNANAQAAGCPAGAYLFSAPYGQADFSSSYRLSNLLGEVPTDPEVTFDVQNLFRSKLRTYDQFTNATHSYYDQGLIILFGLRGTW